MSRPKTLNSKRTWLSQPYPLLKMEKDKRVSGNLKVMPLMLTESSLNFNVTECF